MTFHSEPDEATVTELMTRYGIARVPTAEFHYKTYRACTSQARCGAAGGARGYPRMENLAVQVE